MSLAAATNGDEPRRGTRVRKQFQPYDPTADKPQKKRVARDDSDSDLTEVESSDEDVPAPKGNKRKANGTRKPAAAPAKRRKAAPKNAPVDGIPEGVEGFKTDSPLFNALLQPNVALEPLVEEWVHAYQTSAGDDEREKAAVHELVLFFIRACGLNADIEDHEALDLDGAGEVIERIQDESVKTNPASYPLITRAKSMRSFKPNLTAVITHLVETLSLTPCLFDDADSTKHSVPLMPLLFAWLHSMSSSPLRPIRHTGTFIALKVTSALCQVAATASNELSIKQRQKEAEIKKGATTAAAKRKIEDAENKVKEAHERKTRIEEYMTETDSVMFVHRVRDTDPAIRTDCIRELGVWVKRFPEMYMKSPTFSHFMRSTNDNDGPVRLETMKAVMNVFANASSANLASSFTLRIAPRLVQMAAQDTEIPVRTNAIAVITQIDKTGMLEDDDDEQRAQVARLIFDVEPKVRKAAAAFVKGLWEERAEKLQTEFKAQRDGKKKRAAKIKEADLERHFEWKALAQLLVETSQALEKPEEDEAGPSKPLELVTASESTPTTRASAAAGALYPQIELLQDWYALADYLLLDHSDSETDAWLLTEEEEDFMLEVLITSIRAEEADEEDDQKTKELMKVLPRLFTKHQTEARRIVGILSIPEQMNLSLYLDMRKTAAYEALWDDIMKQFLQHTDATVLAAAIRAINTLTANSSMESTNKQKLAELEESLFASLRDALDGQNVSDMLINDDQLTSIEAILLRVSLLTSSRDIVDVMQDEEGGQSSGWAIVLAFAGRGALGFKEEAKIVEHALHIVMIHIAWLVQRFTEADAGNHEKVAFLKARRDEALNVFETFTVRSNNSASEAVRRQSLLAFISLHNLFSGRGEKAHPASKAIPLEMPSEKQHRIAGVFQAAVERYASDLEENAREEDEDDDMTRAEKQRAVEFFTVVSSFVSAVRIGVLDVEQAKEPLAHYGRFGPVYDAIVKKLVDVLRDEGIYNKEGTTVAHVVREALENSFEHFLLTDDTEPESTIALARLAASAFVVHGTHFTVLKQIHSDDVYDMQVQAIDWVMKKVATLVKQQAAAKDKEARTRLAAKRARVLTFFKPLTLVLGPVSGRDALRIRNHLEELVESSGGPTGTRSSAGYRAYEKRLVSIAGKDADLKVKPRKPESTKNNKSAEIIEDSDIEDDNVSDEEGPTTPKATQNDNEENSDEEVENSQEEAANSQEAPASQEEAPNSQGSAAPSTNGTKRTHPDESLPEIDLNEDAAIDFDQELDLAFPSTDARSRSVSVEPDAKRRKTVRKF